jgi:predicted nucleic acid-binding protein
MVEAVLARTIVIPFDLAVARVHARLTAELRRAGVSVGAHDLQIAATALEGAHQIVTANRRDFDRVPGLTVLPIS